MTRKKMGMGVKPSSEDRTLDTGHPSLVTRRQANVTRRCATCGLPNLDLLRVTMVAERLACSAMTVRREIERGELEAVRVRASWRVTHDSLDAYLRSRNSMEGDEE